MLNKYIKKLKTIKTITQLDKLNKKAAEELNTSDLIDYNFEAMKLINKVKWYKKPKKFKN